MRRKIEIIDTTLRDGEQAAGIAFSMQEKLDIATALSEAGVSSIEAGTPVMGAEEQKAMRAIVNAGLAANIISWNRACREDVLASVGCGFSNIHISVPISDLHIKHKLQKSREWVFERLIEAAEIAKSFGCVISVGAEDASRASAVHFLELAEAAARLGAIRIRYADTVGCMEPFSVYETFTVLVNSCPLPIEFHAHNDFGLATANTLAACCAGVNSVSVTVGGLGERAGNAAMEEIVSAAHSIYHWETGVDLSGYQDISELVARASARPVFPYKPVIGERNCISEVYRQKNRNYALNIQPVLDRVMRENC